MIDEEAVKITLSQDHPGDEDWLAKAFVPTDLTPLLPYVNAAVKRPDYYPEVPAVIWTHEDRRVAVRPHEIAVSHVADTDAAGEEVRKVVAWLNDLWDRRDTIEPVSEHRQLPPLMSVLRLLPMNNCRECGLPTCTAFAVGLIEGDRHIADCPALTSDEGSENAAALREMGIS